MFDKLSLNRSERWSILGAFLIIIGIFLPWYHISYAQEIPWIGIELSGTIYGFSLAFGKFFLLLSAIFTTLLLFPRNEMYQSRMFLVKTFIGSLIVVLFFINVFIHPVFGLRYVDPHIGILVLLIGCVFLIYGLKKGYEDL